MDKKAPHLRGFFIVFNKKKENHEIKYHFMKFLALGSRFLPITLQ